MAINSRPAAVVCASTTERAPAHVAQYNFAPANDPRRQLSIVARVRVPGKNR